MNPITREEALLDGQDLEPITRKEQFIKRIYDKTQEIPEPITREEWFLKKAGEGTSPVIIKQLNATENGTYSEPGKAYSPVIVEVPEPTLITKSITANGTYSASDDNADGYSSVTVAVDGFKKKSIANTPTDIASFNDGTANPMPSLEISIEPQQDLHGYDNPWVGGAGKNKFDIEGWFTTNNISYTKSGNSYTFEMTNDLFLNPYIFSDGNISVLLSTIITYPSGSAATVVGFDLLDANNNLVADRVSTVSSVVDACKIRLNWSTRGEITITTPMIRSSNTDATYEPYSNICPISGHTEANVTRCGKNLFDYTGITEISIGTTTRNGSSFKKSGTYRISAVNGGGYMYARVFNADNTIKATYNIIVGNNVAPATITISNGEYFALYDADTNNMDTSKNLFTNWKTQVELNNVSTAYESYQGSTLSIPFHDSSAVYGGTLDVTSGELRATLADVNLGSLTWSYSSFGVGSSWRTPVLTNMKSYADGEMPDILCEKYKPNTINKIYQDDVGIGIRQNGSIIYVNNQDPVNSPTGQLVYELATPITYQLTPTQVSTLLNQNNIFADCGQILEGEYFVTL